MAFTGDLTMQTNYTIQILKSEHVSGKSASGRDYSFFRHSCIIKQGDVVIEIGDLTTDNELKPGTYPASFEITSYQGKLAAKIVPLHSSGPTMTTAKP
jgi:hypothetical protein